MSTNLVERLLPGLLLFCIAPLLLLTYYNQPYWDDYGFAAICRQVGPFASLKYTYLHAGGRFVSNFFITVGNPLSYGWLSGVKAFALLAIGGQIASIFFGIQTFTKGALATWQAAWYSLGLWLVFVFTIPDLHAGVFWFASLVVHQLACCLLLIVPAAVARAHQSARHKRTWFLLAAGATFLLAGTSELGVFLLSLILLTAAGRSMYAKQYRWAIKWSILLLVLGAGFEIALTAPGNYERMASSPGVAVPLLTLIAQLGHGLRIVMWQPVFFAILVVPMLFSPLLPYLSGCRPAVFRLPLLGGASIVFLGIVGGTSMLSILVNPNLLPRGINVLYWWTLFGWLAACWASLPESPSQLPHFSLALRLLVAALLAVVFTAPTVRAWQEALWEAPRWAMQCEARNVVYMNPRSYHKKITVAPITNVTPHYVLVRGYDIYPYYTHPINKSVASYFGLEAVRTDASWPVRASF
jgi:hypothetical protein